MVNRKDWLKWRHAGIGGSDAPVVMGDSKWKTAAQLLEEKRLPEPPDHKGSFVTDRGNEFEPKIRALYNIENAKNFEPALCESEKEPWLKASLDGRDGDQMMEIKTAGKVDHNGVGLGLVPKKYYAQVQHCLMVSGLKECVYVSYWDPEWKKQVDSKHMRSLVVKRDEAYIEKLYAAEKEFWSKVQSPGAPPVGRAEATLGDTQSVDKVKYWKWLKEQADEINGKLEAARADIIARVEAAGLDRAACEGVRIRKETRKGNIDYKKIEVLQGMDLEIYRGKGIVSWKLDVENE